MPSGSRHRLTGILLSSRRGPVLRVDDGGVYALDLDRDVVRLFGHRVTVDCLRSGFDRLDVNGSEARRTRVRPRRASVQRRLSPARRVLA